MKPECLPFSQIPHTTRLFSDFLSQHPKVHQFYRRPAHFKQWMRDEAGSIEYDATRRERVAAALERQNRSWGASSKTLENIQRLRTGAVAAVTGQQVGVFGGPLFSIFKALTVVKLAEAATESGVECVPVFWLATEDHDLEEVSHVSLLGPEGSLQRVAVSTQGVAGAPVGTIHFGGEIQPALDEMAGLVGESDGVADLRACYRAGESFGGAFAKLFAKWFGEYGVILLDGSDAELHRIARPVYGGAQEKAGEIETALAARGKELEAAGYHQQVKVVPESTLLFALKDGARTVVQRRGKDYVIGDETVSAGELMKRIQSSPEQISGNVLLRPVVQDYLLPTLAYAGGPAEVAYFAQAAVVYQALAGRITPVVPRFSATLIEQKPASLLERFGLNFTDVLKPEPVREQLAARSLAKDLQAAFERAQTSAKDVLAAIRRGLEELDKTLVDAANNAEAKMLHQLESLQGKAARAELRQSEVLDRKAAYLSNALYPNKQLQEREIAGAYFVARHGTGLLRQIYDSIQPDCVEHQVISL